jgi:hypothetical protein
MRNAWIAGFVAAGISLINALIFFSGADSNPQGAWSSGQLAFVVVEAALLTALAYGVLRKGRPAAVLLFFYFWVSRPVLLSMGILKLEVASVLVQVLFFYLFFQGMRGAIVFHRLTHPPYPLADATPSPESGPNPQ